MRLDVNSMIERIKELKKKKNITNAHLSDISGVPYGTLNKILGGETKEPSIIAIAKIAEAMHVTVDYFVTGKVEADSGLSGEEKVHLNKFRKLDTHGKEIVNYILNEECKRSVEQAAVKQAPVPEKKISDFVPRKINTTPENSALVKMKLFQLTTSGLKKDAKQSLNINTSDLVRQADFAVKVSDDSMKNSFISGDILLVESSPQVNEGDIGIFMVNKIAVIREYDTEKLIAHNSRYPDIQINNGAVVVCLGKIIGILEEEDFAK